MQRALIQFAVPKNYQKVKKALLKAHREDLIGNSKNCLIGFAPGKLGYQGKHKSNDSPKNNSNKNTSANKMSNEKNSMSNNKKNSTNSNKKHSNKHSSDNYSNRRKRTI